MTGPMATYAIGDIQGCMRSLTSLLQRIDFTPGRDRLRLVGDIVNRGADSLGVLRWAMQHAHCVDVVLGNHDLALIAAALGLREPRPLDTLEQVLDAPDALPLLTWLRHRPLMLQHDSHVLLHAGLLPHWRIDDALALAHRAEAQLRGPAHRAFLSALAGGAAARDPHAKVHRDVDGDVDAPAVAAARVLTYLRVVHEDGTPNFKFSGPRARVPAGSAPWFAVPKRASAAHTIVCGHWAALGLHLGNNIRAIDTGCVWGGPLTAWAVESDTIVQVPCAEQAPCRPDATE
jgi:bis(5'-nucleosyl)-tetraphosphatase (symmetrical)